MIDITLTKTYRIAQKFDEENFELIQRRNIKEGWYKNFDKSLAIHQVLHHQLLCYTVAMVTHLTSISCCPISLFQ